MIRRRRWLLVVVALATVAGCARVPRIAGPESTRVAFERGVTARAVRLPAVRLDGRIEIDGRATGRLPALVAEAQLAGDAGVRVRTRWLLGAAADVLVREDSMVVWVPAERLAFTLGGIGQAFGVDAPAGWATRLLAGVWNPPGEAWRGAEPSAEGLVLHWLEDGDSLALAVDRDGDPRWARRSRDGRALLVRYDQWREVEGLRWPHAVRIADRDGWFSCVLVLDAARFAHRAHPQWLQLRLPADARRIGWDELRAWLADLGISG